MDLHQKGNHSFLDDSERNDIQSELSKMSFEDLQKLKSKLGSKVYKETVLGARLIKETDFKRKNKNRPREASSKVKPKIIQNVKQKRIADPRFDTLCGTFNEKHFNNTYEFLTDIRKREKEKLKNMLKTEKNSEEVSKIKYLLQRMENQDREAKRRKKEQEDQERERKEKIKALESGRLPHFKTKYEKKIVQLVDKYSELKRTGKIQKYIEKKQKKQKLKEKRTRYFEVNISDNENK